MLSVVNRRNGAHLSLTFRFSFVLQHTLSQRIKHAPSPSTRDGNGVYEGCSTAHETRGDELPSGPTSKQNARQDNRHMETGEP